MSAVIDLLGRQHQEVLARISQDQKRFDGPGVAGLFLDFLEADVIAHFLLEEDVLFPELAKFPDIAAGPLRVMQAEHETFRELLQTGNRARAQGNDAQLSMAATDLAALLQAHIAKEDRVLFPMALAALSEEALRRIDASA